MKREFIQSVAAVVKYDHLLSVVSTIFNAELICTVIGSTSCSV